MARTQSGHGLEPSLDLDTLYGLLPAAVRVRDAAQAVDGVGPLRALMTVLAEQVAVLEEEIAQLYDDQFIETCAEWVVPYLGELIGYRPFDPALQEALGTSRGDVAETIGLRRRKGTSQVLADLATGLTGWDAAVVEFFQNLALTQHLNNLHAGERGTVDLRDSEALELLGTPFDAAPHTADVRAISGRRGPTSARGYWNIPNVGIYLWRVASRPVTDSPAFRVDERRYLFDPLGSDTPLFCASRRGETTDGPPTHLNVAMPMTRRMLHRHLDQLYGPGRSLTVQLDGRVLGPDEVQAADLSDTGPDPETAPWANPAHAKVAIDPVLGRLSLPAGRAAAEVKVSYHRAAPFDLGGGEYDRSRPITPSFTPETPPPLVPGKWPDLHAALAEMAGTGQVDLVGNGFHAAPQKIWVETDEKLEVRAANGSRPILKLTGDLLVGGGDSGEVTLCGLVIAGGRVVVPKVIDGKPNRLQLLRLIDCTLVPGHASKRSGAPASDQPSLVVDAPHVSVEISRSIVGGVRVADESRAAISDSVVDGLSATGVAYGAPGESGTDGTGAGGDVVFDACTVIGKVHTRVLTASNSILHAQLAPGDKWTAPVRAVRRQAGYLRFSYVPTGSQVPQRHKCAPDAAWAPGMPQDFATSPALCVPRFESLRYADPGYALLHASSPTLIRTGADDGGEMGVHHSRQLPQRVAGLWTRLDEYSRIGLDVGVMFAS